MDRADKACQRLEIVHFRADAMVSDSIVDGHLTNVAHGSCRDQLPPCQYGIHVVTNRVSPGNARGEL